MRGSTEYFLGECIVEDETDSEQKTHRSDEKMKRNMS
jgi:hypothetical protein